MCDYSITAGIKTRDAVVDDRLTVTQFGSSKGFAPRGAGEPIAVCLRPGTELAFDKPVSFYDYRITNKGQPHVHTVHRTAVFRQVMKDQPRTHHDMLEFPDGTKSVLSFLDVGQTATVLQLPAKPKTQAEVVEQTRAEFVG